MTYFEILGKSVPESLIQLIKDCLHNNPSSRPTPEEIESTLQNLMHLEGIILYCHKSTLASLVCNSIYIKLSLFSTCLAEANSSQASLLLERLLLGKYRGKKILVVGKQQTGKAALVQCMFVGATSVTQPYCDDAINSVQISIHTPGKENSKYLPKQGWANGSQ